MMGWIYISLLIVVLLMKQHIVFVSPFEKRLTLLALLIVIFVSFRVFISMANYRSAFQMANQFSYFAVGAAIFYFHRRYLMESKEFVITTVLAISIIVNLFALFQHLYPNHAIVQKALYWYGGVGSDSYAMGEHSTLAAICVLIAGRYTSIFSGMHTLGIYNLFVVCVAFSCLNDSQFRQIPRYLFIFVLLLAFLGGALSTSKVFILGVIILLFILILCAIRSVKRPSAVIIASLVLVTVFSYVASKSPIVENIIDKLLRGQVFSFLHSRFGSSGQPGYLTDVMDITFKPRTLLYGLGTYAAYYKYSDCQLRQVIILGGIPLFVLYYGFLVYLLVLNWRVRMSSCYGLPFFALGFTFLFSGIGMPTHLQARVIPLWMLTNLMLAIPEHSFHYAFHDEQVFERKRLRMYWEKRCVGS
jgi:hypothetical protein